MLYLLYLRNGFIKKFPLNKKTIIIGRSTESDLSLNEPFISRKHARIRVFKNHITVEDLGSTNGVFIGITRVDRMKLIINQYFRIGYLNFFLKKGNTDDFIISTKVNPVLSKISSVLTEKGEQTEKTINLLCTEPLIKMLQIDSQNANHSIPQSVKTKKLKTKKLRIKIFQTENRLV